ncbi:MAG TPA: GH116 family glycosyl-hydrolase, partial [Fimbriimonadaceae bacterium]|nr:GH116 family glycosyl-hydrolase [Fimbriimonadaceae bacterium]
MNDVSRRRVLKIAGTAASASMGGRLLAMFDDGSIVRQGHTIPANKNLPQKWIQSLTARGTKEIWKGDELDSIGMPVGGIATGQLYLRGDGTLGWWEIFNHHEFFGYGLTSYAKRPIPDAVEFQISVNVNGRAFNLNKQDFPAVTFRGEHPIGTTTYTREDCPVKVTQSAFSPFIPLNSKDSALPATIFELEITNTSSRDVMVEVGAVLENAVSRSRPDAKRTTKWLTNGFVHTADTAPDPFNKSAPSNRPQRMLADFENGYGEWTAAGEALGNEPASGTLLNQNPVTGFVGKALVNTYRGGDDTKGTLTSPAFTIDRKFLNFKIGGGAHANRTCVNLMVDGKVVRTAAGINNEALLWEAWDVTEFEGTEATLQIVDNMAGPWGHVNVDHIFLADHIESKEDYLRRHGDPNRD